MNIPYNVFMTLLYSNMYTLPIKVKPDSIMAVWLILYSFPSFMTILLLLRKVATLTALLCPSLMSCRAYPSFSRSR